MQLKSEKYLIFSADLIRISEIIFSNLLKQAIKEVTVMYRITSGYNKIVILITLLMSISTAQDSHNYFPHHQGDFWEYQIVYWSDSYTELSQRKIIFDSTDVLGNSYIRDMTIEYSQYPRVSFNNYKIDARGNVYETDSLYNIRYLYFKADAIPGEIWFPVENDTFQVNKLGEVWIDSIFNVVQQAKSVAFYYAYDLNDTTLWLNYLSEILTEDFGLIWKGGGEQFYDMYLNGAVINGILHGDTTTISSVPEPIKRPNNTEKASIKAYPNPFNSNLMFFIDLPEPDMVNMIIYNIEGRIIRRLIRNSRLSAGANMIVWDGTANNGQKASSGLYFYVFRTSTKIERGKLYLIR